jgi:plasmid maintenance system antidote protein VapI
MKWTTMSDTAHIATVREALYGIENNYADPRNHAFVQPYLDEAHSELDALAARIDTLETGLDDLQKTLIFEREQSNRLLHEAIAGRTSANEFQPDYAVPPGDTLRELLEMRGWTQALLAREIGWSLKHVNRVIKGHETISVDFALALERLDLGTAEFWIAREGHYRIRIARAALADAKETEA